MNQKTQKITMEASGMLAAKYPLLSVQDVLDARNGKAGKVVQQGVTERVNYRAGKLAIIETLRGRY